VSPNDAPVPRRDRGCECVIEKIAVIVCSTTNRLRCGARVPSGSFLTLGPRGHGIEELRPTPQKISGRAGSGTSQTVSPGEVQVVEIGDPGAPVIDVNVSHKSLISSRKLEHRCIDPKSYVRHDHGRWDGHVVPSLTPNCASPSDPAHGRRRIFRLDAVTVNPHSLRNCHAAVPSIANKASQTTVARSQDNPRTHEAHLIDPAH
jgi:hypothetical protein